MWTVGWQSDTVFEDVRRSDHPPNPSGSIWHLFYFIPLMKKENQLKALFTIQQELFMRT